MYFKIVKWKTKIKPQKMTNMVGKKDNIDKSQKIKLLLAAYDLNAYMSSFWSFSYWK